MNAYVARAGIDRPDVALPLLAGLTPRWSSERPIRPFIERHPALAYEHLRCWVSDPDEHVRRLVTEGTRRRLPGAPRLRGLVADPTPNIELLAHLVDDASAYVRRSVANHHLSGPAHNRRTLQDFALVWTVTPVVAGAVAAAAFLVVG